MGNLKIIKNMEQGSLTMQINHNTMENGNKGINMDKGCIFTPIKMSILGDGLMARNMEMEHMSSMLQQ